jgi:hypothetical protein
MWAALTPGLLVAFAAGASGQGVARSIDVPFIHGLDVSINGGAPMHFGLDTGAATDFFITPESARRLGLPVTGHRLIHASDRKDATVESVDIVRAKTLTFAGHTFAEPEGLVEQGKGQGDGTLGITLFRDVLLTLDYPHDRLGISEGSLPLSNDHDIFAYTTYPDATFRVLQVTPTVTIQLAGQALPALLDTAASHIDADIIVPTKVAATLPLGPTEASMMIGGAIGSKYPSYTAKLKGNLTIGDIVVSNPTLLVSDWLTFIDLARVSRRFIYMIDQRNHRIRITMPDGAPSRLPTTSN